MRAMGFHAHMPQSFWAEAMQHACHVLNLLPSDAISGKVPWKGWTGKELTIDMLQTLHPFGTLVHAHIPRQRRWTKGNIAAKSSLGCIKWSAIDQTPTDTAYKYWDFEHQTFHFTHHLILTTRFPKDSEFGVPSAAPPIPGAGYHSPTPQTVPASQFQPSTLIFSPMGSQ